MTAAGGTRGRATARPPAPARHRGRVAAVLAAALALAAAPAGPTRAAAPRVLVLRAATSGWVDVAFRQPVTIDNDAVAVRGATRYAGFYLHPLRGPDTAGTGAMFLHAYRAPGFTWRPLPVGRADFLGYPPHTVPAGRYRLYVLADGPVEVRVPVLKGHPGGTLRAAHPARVAYVARDVTAQAVPRPDGRAAPGAVRAQLPITVVSPRTISFTTIQVIRHGSYYTSNYTQPESCIGAAEHPACVTETKEGNGAVFRDGEYRYDSTPLRNGELAGMTGRYYFPGQIAAGEWTAHFSMGTTDSIDRVVVAAMSIGL